MTQRDQVFKCETCGNVVSVVHAATGDLVCCGQNMMLVRENTVDAAVEKHVPVMEQDGATVTVKVGSVSHPMQDDHYIEVISVLTDTRLYRAYKKPGDDPEAVFTVEGTPLFARAYCNLHGLWKSN